jgi:nitrite reductase (NO-forming)
MEEGLDMAGHDMGGMAFDAHMSTMPGGSTTIKFTPQEAGEYEVFCTVEGHKEAGMIGKLVVVDQN